MAFQRNTGEYIGAGLGLGVECVHLDIRNEDNLATFKGYQNGYYTLHGR